MEATIQHYYLAANQHIPRVLRCKLCNACDRRCLLTGSAHDLPAVFKLSRMWFSLGADMDIVAEMTAAASEAPSYKFLPLAYQLASRLSRAGRNPALDESGFSVRILPTWLLVK